jgi:FkbM family methyltransferase
VLIPITDILSNYKITCNSIAHFGAHHGQEVDSYLKNNFTEIHLFEPQSSCFSILQKKFGQNKAITLHNFALGSQSETSVLNLGSGDGQASSILKPGLHAELYPYIEFTESENIEIKRFDELGLSNIRFLNIDIQGFELEALKGCEKFLVNKIHYIYTEVNRKHVYKNCTLIQEIDEYLEKFDLVRVKTRWWNMLTPWGDAFYIKSKRLSVLQKLKTKLVRLLRIEFLIFTFYDLISCISNFYNFFLNKFRNLKNIILPA